MAPQLGPAPGSPYEPFQQDRCDCRNEPNYEPRTISTEDGILLFGTGGWNMLLDEIVRHNDVPLLKQYLSKYPEEIKPPHPSYMDIFMTATCNGSIHALQILLEHYAVVGTSNSEIPAPNDRGFLLLNVACANAQIQMIRFLLDNYPQYADIHARDTEGFTAILSVAGAGNWAQGIDPEDVIRYEEVMNLLLDKGASALDTVPNKRATEHTDQSGDSVLTLAACWAGPELIRRLTHNGAQVHEKVTHESWGDIFYCDRGFRVIWDMTPIFQSCLYANVPGTKSLLDQRGSDVQLQDMVSSCDSSGRLPLHWASLSSSTPSYNNADGIDIASCVQRTVDIINILLEINPRTINVQDMHGNTALHYAADRVGPLGSDHTPVIELLCKRGANAGLRNNDGKTPLHILFRPVLANPVDPVSVVLLLAHGATTSDCDASKKTPLHYAVKPLHYIEAVKVLLAHGADPSAKDEHGNTPVFEVYKGQVPREVEGVYGPGERNEQRKKALANMIEILHTNKYEYRN